MSEWKPFITMDCWKNNLKSYEIAIQNKRYKREKFQIWPYDHKGKTCHIVVYGKTFNTANFRPQGFLCLTDKGQNIKDNALCQKIAQDFIVWAHLYHHPPFKFVPKGYFELLKKTSKAILENCKRRQELNRYDESSPSKQAYTKILKKLDSDVIQNSRLLMINLTLSEKMISSEKSLWQRCSSEKMEKLRAFLPKYAEVSVKLGEHYKKRSDLFYEYEKAIKEAYKIDLQVTKTSLASRLGISFLLYLANSNLVILAIPYLPEALKLIYQEIAGHKSLLRNSKRFLKKGEKLAWLATVYSEPVDSSLIRNLLVFPKSL
jgi:hypothetical protein